jgi:hypothetical protein
MVEVYYNVQSDNGSLTPGKPLYILQRLSTNRCLLCRSCSLAMELQILREYGGFEGSSCSTETSEYDESCRFRRRREQNDTTPHVRMVNR